MQICKLLGGMVEISILSSIATKRPTPSSKGGMGSRLDYQFGA